MKIAFITFQYPPFVQGRAKEKGIIPAGEILSFKSLPIYKYDVMVRITYIEKAKIILGWEPRVSLEQALHKCIDVAIENI